MTFYFYDLETSSGSPRTGRIMQFAGQRTNERLEPIGKPDNLLVKLTPDIVPEPDAILVHKITPQQTLHEGMSEADFAAFFQDTIATSDTVFVGFNNIRFDDEFMRFLCYRTFYDPYEWHWKHGRSRWDLMDVMRMMRALRPEGLQWPDLAGKPTVKLELLAQANHIVHEQAHDALSDVLALIELARLVKQSQPKLFDYLLMIRDKKRLMKVVESGEPFVYTSGKYASEWLKTTVVMPLLKHPRRDAMIVYDLRCNPTTWLEKTPKELAEHWAVRYGDDKEPLPVKTMQYNRCPAVAPVSVLDEASQKRIGYTDQFLEHMKILSEHHEFIEKISTALDILEKKQQTSLLGESDVDTQLYDGFWDDKDRAELETIRHADVEAFSALQAAIKNKRLRDLMPLYKARNFPTKLTPEEYQAWETYRKKTLLDGGESSHIAKFYYRLKEIAETRTLSSDDEYVLSELQLYIESIVPVDD